MTQVTFLKFKDFMEADNISTVKSRVDEGWSLFKVSSGAYE